MKRVLLVSVLLLVAISFTFSQIAYQKGDQVASIMIGLGSTLAVANATSSTPPLTLAFDYGYNENISLGGLFAYAGSSYEYSYGGYGYKFSYSDIIIAGRGLYHYDLLHNEKIDTYGGLLLGYNIASSSSEYTGNWPAYYGKSEPVSVGGIIFGAFAGARYYFTPNLAAQAEVGYGLSILSIGVAYKL
jgi:hypothetical protein